MYMWSTFLSPCAPPGVRTCETLKYTKAYHSSAVSFNLYFYQNDKNYKFLG